MAKRETPTMPANRATFGFERQLRAARLALLLGLSGTWTGADVSLPNVFSTK